MSWKERQQTDYTITTGDGKSYTPLWLNASKNIEYNVAQFVYKELEGTFVKRGTPRGTQYAIEIYFQGEDHLEVSKAFETSAANPAVWQISHPLYGSILVQPIGLIFDNSGYNITKITGGIVETIPETPDKAIVSAPDKIVADKVALDAEFARAYAANVPDPKTSDLQDMLSNASGAYASALGKIRDTGDAQQYLNLYNNAQSAITSAVIDTFSTLTELQAFYSAPFLFQDSVVNRIGMLGNMLAYLTANAHADMSRAAKLLYEASAGTLITSAIAAAVTNIGKSYSSRRQVLETITTIISAYNTYLATLDLLQSLTGGLPGSYIPTRGPLTTLGGLVGYAVNALLDIAAGSRQERSFFLEEDSNIILLTDRLYGLKADDSTIDEFMAVNEIGLNEILGIKKGRKITYYV